MTIEMQPSALPFFFSDEDLPCKAHPNPDDFTATDVRHAGKNARARAKACCRGCPLRLDCLTWAMGTRQSGVFGGEWLIMGKIQNRR